MNGSGTSCQILPLTYSATPQVQEVIDSIGRLEDVRFSPDLQRLAIAGFGQNKIVMVDVDIHRAAGGKQVFLRAATVLTSADLKEPHGLDFIDAQTLAVANRGGSVCLLELPARADTTAGGQRQVTSSAVASDPLLDAPGSVAACTVDQDYSELLVCNNHGHTVSRHQVARDSGALVGKGEVLLQKWLDVPDGISMSQSRRWIAVSNHKLNVVMLYRSTPELHPEADPTAILLGVHYPHGLRITEDDRYILVADAGAPLVHIYARHAADWQGLHYPIHSLRVMDDATFQFGRYNLEEGGPKGLDLHAATGILVTSCATQPLVFFDIEQVVGSAQAPTGPTQRPVLDAVTCAHAAVDICFELERLQRHAWAKLAEEQLQAVLRSHSWRLSAPLRWLRSALKPSDQA